MSSSCNREGNKFRKVKLAAQGHTASERWRWAWDPAPEPVLRPGPASVALPRVRTERAGCVTAPGAVQGVPSQDRPTAFSFLLPRQGMPGARVHLPHVFCPVRWSQKQSYRPSAEEAPPF